MTKHPQPANLRVRRASAADARAIAEIGVKSWQAAYRSLLPDAFLDGLLAGPREAAWRSLLESDEADASPAWLAEREGVAVGYLAGGPPRDEDVPLPGAEVYAIYVLPEAWRGGAGRALLAAGVDHWRRQGAGSLVLWVLEGNAAGRAFYEALGWRPDGARQRVDFGGFSTMEVRYRLRP
jgi:GNAT superfamily N-acetyltransferase